ncbi:unnamed protein product [Menidia menidia]|uniref:(Atlantic silverside) hypothetical protein n=1 Tax=Menidia menidia TaxID=238744 RepID=A0A8S4BWZ3_9TELE|nr:unnamed protein product [Menidia menidia]
MLQPEFTHAPLEENGMLKNSGEDHPKGAEEGEERGERSPFCFTPQRIHLNKDHELFEDGDILRHMYLQDLYISETEDKQALSVSEFACHISGCTAVFSTLEEYEHHYNSLHRHVCCTCHRSFPSAQLLDIHIQEWHDSVFAILAQKQDMYQCLVAGCGLMFRTSKQRKDHLIRIHKYPPDFRFDKSKDRGTREAKRQTQKDSSMVVEVDACEADGEQEESMETHVSEEATSSETVSGPVKPQYSYRLVVAIRDTVLRVPSNVCFGHSSVRGFRGRRRK